MKGATGTNARQNNAGESKPADIDTTAPFASVKAAVSLFGEVRTRKPKQAQFESPAPRERESPLLLAKKELTKYKEKLSNAETSRSQALAELERAKVTVDELTNKLISKNESKNTALEAAETAKDQTKQLDLTTPRSTDEDRSWEWEVENSRKLYAAVTMELGAAKQDLRKIKKDFEALVESRLSAIQQEAEAKQLLSDNNQKVMEFSKEIGIAQGSLVHMRTATEQVQKEESMILSEKAAAEDVYKQVLKETVQKLASLKKDFDPEVPAELHGAKVMLQKLAKEESSLVSLLESLKMEVEAARTEHEKLKKKDADTESIVNNLHLMLQKRKAELEAAIAGELKLRSPSEDDLIQTLQQLSSDSQKALQEAEEMKRSAQKLRGEAGAARLALEKAEKKLQVALKDAKEAKSAEVRALDLLKEQPERENVPPQAIITSVPASNIKISKEDYESLISKVAEFEKLLELKTATAVTRKETIESSENETNKKFVAIQKEMEDIERATEEAVRRANLAEAAKKVVEGQLKGLREKETDMAIEIPTRELAEIQEIQMSERFPPKPETNFGSHGFKLLAEKTEENRRFGKPISKKVFKPHIGGFFHRKKSISGGPTASPNPAEKPI